MVTAVKRQHRDRMVRRGLGLIIESDFYRHAAGRKFFSDQLTSIQFCVAETCNYDVMYGLLTCNNYDFDYDLRKKLLPHRNIISAMQKEVTNFCALQKDDNGLDLAVTKAKATMARYRVRPDTLIMPPEMQLYATMVPNSKTVYSVGGPKGVADFDNGPEAFASQAFRDLIVHTSMPFDQGDNVDALQLLRRNTQVGEFYRMRAPQAWDTTTGLTPNYMDILIFDEKTDRLAHITFLEALKAALPLSAAEASEGGANDSAYDVPCGPFAGCDGSAGKLNPGWGTMDPLGLGASFKEQAKMLSSVNAKTFERAAAIPGFLDAFNTASGVAKAKDAAELKAGLSAYFGNGGRFKYRWGDFEVVSNLVACGIWLPLQIVIARPFIEHAMYSAIVAVAGEDTGATLFGPAGKLCTLPLPAPCDSSIHSLTRLYSLLCSQTCKSPRTLRSRPSRGTLACSNSHAIHPSLSVPWGVTLADNFAWYPSPGTTLATRRLSLPSRRTCTSCATSRVRSTLPAPTPASSDRWISLGIGPTRSPRGAKCQMLSCSRCATGFSSNRSLPTLTRACWPSFRPGQHRSSSCRTTPSRSRAVWGCRGTSALVST